MHKITLFFCVLLVFFETGCSRKISSSEQAILIWNKLVGRKSGNIPAEMNDFKIKYQGIGCSTNGASEAAFSHCSADSIKIQSKKNVARNSSEKRVIYVLFLFSAILISIPFLLAIF